MKILRFFVVAFGGAFGGALLGAILFGGGCFIINHGDQSPTFFGPADEIWLTMSVIAAIYAVGPGFVIGLLVGATGCGQVRGALTGSLIGLVVTAIFLRSVFNEPPMIRQAESMFTLLLAVAPMLLGALLGFVLSQIGFWFEKPKPLTI